MSINESIVEDAVREGLEAPAYAIGHKSQIAVGAPTADDVVGPAPRISKFSSPNLDLISSYLVARSPVLFAGFSDLGEAMP